MDIISKNFGSIFIEPFLYYDGLVLDGNVNKIFEINKKISIEDKLINTKEVFELIVNDDKLPINSNLNNIGEYLFFNANNSTIYLNFNDGVKNNFVKDFIYFNQSNKIKFITFRFWKLIIKKKYKLSPLACEIITKQFAESIIEKFK